LLEKAFDRNQDMPGLAKNLARVQCMAGDGAAARNILRTVLNYFPNLQDLQALRAQMGPLRHARGEVVSTRLIKRGSSLAPAPWLFGHPWFVTGEPIRPRTARVCQLIRTISRL
jgi:hypothetical protein